ncbi:MAG TPA: PAS domain-containing protein [Steroidobacter sp.]|nr:PAS domain-containing protein [Steroidobacter sp.]
MSLRANRSRRGDDGFDVRLRQALRAVKVGVWRLDLMENNRVTSDEVAALMGLPDDAVLTHECMAQAVHPEDLERVRAIARRALEEGSSFESDCRLVWPDGSVHWAYVRGAVYRNAAGQPERIMGVVQDIERRKALELALQESQRSLCSLISHLPGVVYRFRNDRKWTVEFVSDGVLALTGYPPSAFLKGETSFDELTHPEDREAVWRAAQQALRQRTTYQVNYRLVTASGAEKWVWEQGAGVYSEEGELQLREGIITDVTDRKRADERNARLEQRLRQAQKMEELGTLAGGIAHDFNNVLTAIRGNASLAIADLPPDSPALISVHEIKRSALRAAELVRQILTFSRQERTGLRPIALEPVMSEAVKLLRATLPPRIEIRCDFAPTAPPVLADATQIHQVVMNLGVNAAQAIDTSAGLIEFILDGAVVDEETRRSVGLAPGRYVRLAVRDNGVGMDKEMQERVFDPFFTTKPLGQGTGLGLSVVHGIAQSHGGAITVDSAPGEGATFCLYLPVAEQAVDSDEVAPPPPPRGHGEHILFVDDEEALVFLAERALRRLGYKVTALANPSRALEVFCAEPQSFDFVVTDMSMPALSGCDLAQEVLRLRPDLPVVLTSGYVRPEDVQEARRIGAYDLVYKPNSVEDLASVINDALASRGQRVR